MLTPFGKNLNKDCPLAEYPRPQLVRDSYICLNGPWRYALSQDGRLPQSFGGTIIVPFSPESELSGAGFKLNPNEHLFYKRCFTLDKDFNQGRVILHFGAVDQWARVSLNGSVVGEHLGGYTAFSFDITDYLADDGNELLVEVVDLSDTSYHSRGKQKTNRGGIWYTAQSGIWQTVWLESVPRDYIKSLKIVPLYDESKVHIEAEVETESEAPSNAVAHVFGRDYSLPCDIALDSFESWSPQNPRLYDFSVTLGRDKVNSYFAMRKFSVQADDKGIKRLFLNNAPYFHHGLLDQGYYSDGLYTPPSDEAMIFDIQTAKSLGFNMLRKHIKIEPLRWYYHCDRLGMLVWQDMINGGGAYSAFTISAPLVTGISLKDNRYRLFARQDERGRQQYYRELNDMITQLINCPCIAMWVPFNEGWGQFDARLATEKILALDTTRTIDHASGWHDQRIGDIQSLHVYFKKYRFKPDKLKRAVVLSEFGGYNLRLNGHCFNSKDFGYKRFSTVEELTTDILELYAKQIAPAIEQGLSAAVYTQLTDVEDELNGLITYDRRVIKLTKPIRL